MIKENLVLVCEHNHNDIVFFQYEWPRLPFPATLLILQTGSEALAFLRKRAETCSGGLRLVLCEMKLPHCNGLELLNYVKQTPGLKHIPVIMTGLHFTPNDTKQALEAGAFDCWQKPISLGALTDLLVENSQASQGP